MVRHGYTLRRAVTELELGLSNEQVAAVEKRKAFQDALWAERNRYHAEIANQPGHNKQAAVGLLLLAIEKLAEACEWDKAIQGIEKLAKLEGWLGAESNVNIFGSITARDIEEAKQRLLAGKAEAENSKTLPN